MNIRTVRLSNKVFVCLVVLMVIEVIGCAVFYAHQRQYISSLEDTYTHKQNQLGQARLLASQLVTVKETRDQDREQLSHLEMALPSRDYMPTLLVQLQRLATDTHNQILNFQPLPVPPAPAPAAQVATHANAMPVSGQASNNQSVQVQGATAGSGSSSDSTKQKNFYEQRQMDMDIQGAYPSVMSFLLALTQFPKIVAVDQFDISSQSAALNAQMLVTGHLKFTAYLLKGS